MDTSGFILTGDGAGDTTVSGAVSGTGGVVKNGSGTLALSSNASSYTGLTVVTAGILSTGAANALGSTVAGTLVNSGATLRSGGFFPFTTAEPLTLNGTGVGRGQAGSEIGALQLNTRATWTGPIALGSDATISSTFTAGLTVNTNPVALNGHTLTVMGSGPTALASPIVDGSTAGGSLVVVNDAPFGEAWTFSAANTYTGSTTISNGLLDLTGAAGSLASEDITLGPAATLQMNNQAVINTNRLADNAAAGVVTFGSLVGNVPHFRQVSVINNVNDYVVTLQYTANALDVIVATPMSTPIISDDGDATFSATSGFFSFPGQGFQDDVSFAEAGTGSETATWTFTGLTPGLYRIAATWTEHPNRATNAPFTVLNGGTEVATHLLDQRQAPLDFFTSSAGWKIVGAAQYAISQTDQQCQRLRDRRRHSHRADR
jgi:autotransporter-associated beta strand protein